MAITSVRQQELCEKYGYDGKIAPGSAYAAAAASFKFDDTSVGQDDLVWLISHVGESCAGGTIPPEEYVGANLAVLDRVIDSDTVSAFLCPNNMCTLAPLEPDRLRLWHVSGPSAEYPSGTEATNWLKSKLPTGGTFSFDNKGSDPYGRILAIIYDADGNNLNEGLIATGYAKPWSAEESEIEEEELEPVGAPVLQYTGNKQYPVGGISLGVQNWVGVEYINVGDAPGRYWLGIRLEDTEGTSWRFTGDPQYASIIQPDETKMYYVAFTPPTTLVGVLRIFIILNRDYDYTPYQTELYPS